MFLTPPLQSRTPQPRIDTHIQSLNLQTKCVFCMECYSVTVLQYSRIFVMVELSVKYLNDT